MQDDQIIVTIDPYEGTVAIGKNGSPTPVRKWMILLLCRILKTALEEDGARKVVYAIGTDEDTNAYCVCGKILSPEPTTVPIRECADSVICQLTRSRKAEHVILKTQTPVFH